MFIYSCFLIEATGSNIDEGCNIVTPAEGVTNLGILIFGGGAPPRFAALSLGAKNQTVQTLSRLENFSGLFSETYTFTRDARRTSPARVTVAAADGARTVIAWPLGAAFEYSGNNQEPILLQVQPAHVVRAAQPIPYRDAEGDFVNAAVLVRASDWTGARTLDIAGFGTAVVVGLWADGSEHEGSSEEGSSEEV